VFFFLLPPIVLGPAVINTHIVEVDIPDIAIISGISNMVKAILSYCPIHRFFE
jgi:hypothetical protein